MMMQEKHGDILDREMALGKYKVSITKLLAFGVSLAQLYSILRDLGTEMVPEQAKRLEVVNIAIKPEQKDKEYRFHLVVGKDYVCGFCGSTDRTIVGIQDHIRGNH